MIPVVTLFAKSAKAVVWSRSWNRYFVRLIVPEILRCIDFGVLAWNCLFMPLFGVFFSIFPHMTLPIAMTPPPKGPSFGRNTSFEPFSVRISATVRPGRVREKKYRITKVTMCYIPFGGSPHWTDSTQKLHTITCAKFHIEIFMGYITGGRIFDFPIDFCMDHTTMQRCLWSVLSDVPVDQKRLLDNWVNEISECCSTTSRAGKNMHIQCVS